MDTSTVAPTLTAELAAQAMEHGIGKCVPSILRLDWARLQDALGGSRQPRKQRRMTCVYS